MTNMWWVKIKRSLRNMWPKFDSDLEGAKQKTPFNVNRFVLLAIILIYTATSACIYFDWSATRNLLLKAEKYAELNDGNITDKTNTPQYKRINKLYPTTLAIHFTMSVFCGFLYDHIGPKLTAALGQLFNITCWILLSLNTTRFDATLLGFIFMALGADTAFIPTLTISNLFPDGSIFILTLIGAAASLSFAVPTTLNFILASDSVSFNSVCYGYIFIILVPCFLVALLLLPLKPFKGVDDIEREENRAQKKMVALQEMPSKTAVDKGSNTKQGFGLQEVKDSVDYSELTTNEKNGSVASDVNKTYTESMLNTTGRKNSNTPNASHLKEGLSKNHDEEHTTEKHAKNAKGDIYANLDLENINEAEMGKKFHWASIKIFLKLLITFPSLCVIIYFIIFNISIVFYGMVNEIYFEYDKSIIVIINILAPLSCIPCIIFGRLVNRFGATIIIITMNACSLLMHMCALIKYKVFGVFSAIFYMFTTSMYTSQIYCFIQNAFPTIVFGKFVGFASLCGGLFALFCQLLYDSVSENSETKQMDPSSVSYSLIFAFIILFIPLTILQIRKYERVPELLSAADKKKEKELKENVDVAIP